MNFIEKILAGMSCLQPQWQMSLKPNETCKVRAWLFISSVKVLVRIWVLVFLPPASANTDHQPRTKEQSNMCSVHLKGFLVKLNRQSPGNLQDSVYSA